MFSLFRSKKDKQQAAPPPSQLTLLPGSQGEHQLQKQYGTRDRALKFYDRQVLNYLSPVMTEFISRQEVLFIATSDKHGECDCSARFGLPGFVKILNEKYLVYPEYRGNGVMASQGNIVEYPHIGMIFVDFFDSTVGLHVNGKARICEHENLLDFVGELPQEVIDAINTEGKQRPERWIMVEIEEAYLHCSKHIPLLKKMDKSIDWGTDNAAAKRSDYFKLDDIPLYNRIGGDIAMNILVDRFYRKILADKELFGLFDNLDLPTQLKKQKQFLKMALGGYPSEYFDGKNLRKIYHELINNSLTNHQFDGIMRYFEETMLELNVPENEVQAIMAMFDTSQHEITVKKQEKQG
jgi:truncated hemoglobin YjbI/predicted pyridoxine 5'-phosphate oxidase superfamily flavin-nucleotide-binding protein